MPTAVRIPSNLADVAIDSRIAAVALAGHRAVVLDAQGEAQYADNTDLTHVDRVIGITTQAVVQGAQVAIQSVGRLGGLAGLTPNTGIWLSTNGQLTQTPPTTGFAQRLGWADSTSSIIITIGEAIVLA